MSERIESLRTAISTNDRRIVEAMNERLRLVDELWRLKDELGLEHVDPRRERMLLAELERANGGPLSQEGLERLVGELLELTKRELGAE
jgi:chorismate mutase